MNKPFAPDRLIGAGPAIGPARFTADEFLRMADLGAFDDMKVELVHGEIIRMTPPNNPHASMQARLIGELYAATNKSAGLRGDVGIRLSDDTVRGFDAALVATGADKGVLAPDQVDLAVEVADTSLEQDLGAKARDYAGANLPLYWVVDVNARVVHVMSDPQDGAYSKREVVRFGEPLGLPGGQGSITLD